MFRTKHILFLLITPLLSYAEPQKQVHLDFVLKRPNFFCSGNRTISVDTDILFCDKYVDGRHFQFHVTVKPGEKSTLLLKGSLQEIDQDGAVSRVNELGIRTVAGEMAEGQSGEMQKERPGSLGNWTNWTVKADLE